MFQLSCGLGRGRKTAAPVTLIAVIPQDKGSALEYNILFRGQGSGGFMKNFVSVSSVFVVMSAFLFGCSHPPMMAVSPAPPQPPAKAETLLSSPSPKRIEVKEAPSVPKPVEEPVTVPLPTPAAANETTAATPLSVTPLIAFTKPGVASNNDFRDCYTRILISNSMNPSSKGKGGGGNSALLPYNERWAIRRYAWGYKRDVSLTAKIRIGEYESITPLMTLSHQSDKDGQYWCRSVSQMLLDFPLFLVKEDGGANVPDIRFSLVGNKDRQSNMAAIGLLAVTTAVQQVNPSAKVLTKLTEQSTKDAARAVDGAIGKLFSSGIKEEHVTDCDFRTWDSGNGIKVILSIPKDEDGDWDTSDLHPVGEWIVSFDEPRPSIFSDRRICKSGNNLCSADRHTALKAVYEDPESVTQLPDPVGLAASRGCFVYQSSGT